LDFEVHGRAGTLITVIARDELGHIARADSTMNLETALKQPLTSEFLQQQLGRLGGTPFHIGRVENRLEGGVVLPVKELNRLRRELVTELQRQRALPKQWQMNPPVPLPSICSRSPNNVEPELVVLVRNLDQLDAALSTGIRKIYCEFEDLKKYREAVTRVHTGSCDLPEREIWVAPPRIFKMGEEWILDQVLSSRADGYLVRNYDHLKAFATQRRIADFSLNVANALSAQYFMDREVERVTASYDLNIDQLTNLLKSAPAEWFEVTLHQHMPMFHMEHCVFCAFLSDGTDYRDCGRPCDKHEVKLKDRVGAQHPLKADAGCRNTVFNAMAQTGAEFFERLTEAGARRFRVEFLNETPEEVRTTIAQYRKLLRGETSGSKLWRELRLLNQLGVTRGQLAGSKVV